MYILNHLYQVHLSLLMCQATLFSAHSDLGIGGLQFGQPFSTGINGAGHYGMPMLCCYCIPLLIERIFQCATIAL